MNVFTIDGIKVVVNSNDSDEPVTNEEAKAYVDYAKEQMSKIKEAQSLTGVSVSIINGEAAIEFKYSTVNFERIRRITGNRLWESPSNDTEIAA